MKCTTHTKVVKEHEVNFSHKSESLIMKCVMDTKVGKIHEVSMPHKSRHDA